MYLARMSTSTLTLPPAGVVPRVVTSAGDAVEADRALLDAVAQEVLGQADPELAAGQGDWGHDGAHAVDVALDHVAPHRVAGAEAGLDVQGAAGAEVPEPSAPEGLGRKHEGRLGAVQGSNRAAHAGQRDGGPDGDAFGVAAQVHKEVRILVGSRDFHHLDEARYDPGEHGLLAGLGRS
jgi:hypothetical protein